MCTLGAALGAGEGMPRCAVLSTTRAPHAMPGSQDEVVAGGEGRGAVTAPEPIGTSGSAPIPRPPAPLLRGSISALVVLVRYPWGRLGGGGAAH